MKIGFLRQDDDCHWYLIPTELLQEFDNLFNLINIDDNLCDDFNDKFDKYRLSGGPFALKVIMDV